MDLLCMNEINTVLFRNSREKIFDPLVVQMALCRFLYCQLFVFVMPAACNFFIYGMSLRFPSYTFTFLNCNSSFVIVLSASRRFCSL